MVVVGRPGISNTPGGSVRKRIPSFSDTLGKLGTRESPGPCLSSSTRPPNNYRAEIIARIFSNEKHYCREESRRHHLLNSGFRILDSGFPGLLAATLGGAGASANYTRVIQIGLRVSFWGKSTDSLTVAVRYHSFRTASVSDRWPDFFTGAVAQSTDGRRADLLDLQLRSTARLAAAGGCATLAMDPEGDGVGAAARAGSGLPDAGYPAFSSERRGLRLAGAGL